MNRRTINAIAAIALVSTCLSCSNEKRDGQINGNTWRISSGPVSTGLHVDAGSIVRITTEGKVDLGGAFLGFGAPKLHADGDGAPTPSNYPAPSLRKNSLIVRIGSHSYQGGRDVKFSPTSSGEIVLGVNDADAHDNSQGWEVTIAITKPVDGETVHYGEFTVTGQRTLDISVTAGSKVHVSASGHIDFGGAVLGAGAPRLDADGDSHPVPADYPAPHLRKNSLIVKIGHLWYQGGTDIDFAPTHSGRVFLTANDNVLEDNSRHWNVILSVTPPTPKNPTGSTKNEYGPLVVVGRPVRTGVQVSRGESVRVESSGLIDFGGALFGGGAPVLDADGDDWKTPSDYPAPDLRKNSLVVKIGSKSYQGGVDSEFEVSTSGEIELFPNDNQPRDNSRGWHVRLTVVSR